MRRRYTHPLRRTSPGIDSEMDSMKMRLATVVTMQTLRSEVCWNHDRRRYHPASGRQPALDSRGVVALSVSLYLGLLNGELPFRGNLSEGSVLIGEFTHYTARLGPVFRRAK